ncbi:MAG: osmotically-inducible protein OsmY [Rickettsiales bacterium]|jgi:osmotically-inducible protein OsmY
MKKYLSIYLAIALLTFTTSCVETIVAGAAGSAILANQDKTVKNTTKDIVISTKIDSYFIAKGLKSPTNKIGVSVDNQRVLLTGIVNDENLVKKANEIAWETTGVKEVIDEIQVYKNKSLARNFFNYFTDTSITARISSKALFNNKISTLNIDVTTINTVVYLFGTAKSKNEIKEISNIAANTIGVQKVISHIVLK